MFRRCEPTRWESVGKPRRVNSFGPSLEGPNELTAARLCIQTNLTFRDRVGKSVKRLAAFSDTALHKHPSVLPPRPYAKKKRISRLGRCLNSSCERSTARDCDAARLVAALLSFMARARMIAPEVSIAHVQEALRAGD